MVMTESSKPRLSGAGIVLAFTLITGGWLSAPARSCPDQDKPTTEFAQAAETGVAGSAVLVGNRNEGKRDENRGEMEERLERLEAELDRLSDQLERIGDKLDDGSGAPAERSRRVPGAAALVPGDIPDVHGEAPPPPGFADAPVPPTPPGARFDDGPIVVRAYQLPEGKLEALSALMSRQDVSIRVRAREDRMEVHASERNQAIFKGFVDLISSKKQVRAYRVSPGKLEKLSELMVRSDVAIFVEPGREVIKVHGSSLEQSVFAAFVEMIDPGTSVREAHGEVISEEPVVPRPPTSR